MCKMTQEVGSQKRKGGQSMNLGALILKIRCETNSIRIDYGDLLGGRDLTLAWQMDSPPRLYPCAWWFTVREFLAKKSITKINYPPYSPGNVMLLQGIPENYFQDCFWQWQHHFTKCIASWGEYFEGDSSR
jgi:hypothetical protein